MNKLIEKAKSFKKKEVVHSTEELELAISWLEDEITASGVARAIGFSGSANTYVNTFLLRALRQAFKKGLIIKIL